MQLGCSRSLLGQQPLLPSQIHLRLTHVEAGGIPYQAHASPDAKSTVCHRRFGKPNRSVCNAHFKKQTGLVCHGHFEKQTGLCTICALLKHQALCSICALQKANSSVCHAHFEKHPALCAMRTLANKTLCVPSTPVLL